MHIELLPKTSMPPILTFSVFGCVRRCRHAQQNGRKRIGLYARKNPPWVFVHALGICFPLSSFIVCLVIVETTAVASDAASRFRNPLNPQELRHRTCSIAEFR
jgi:hypothetical protein